MRISVGTDIVQIKRVTKLIDGGHLQRMLAPTEIQRNDPEHIAGLIAIKEAAIKALGLSADDWLKLVIRRDGPRPVLDLLERPNNIESLDCSVSHDGDYAFATVVVLYR